MTWKPLDIVSTSYFNLERTSHTDKPPSITILMYFHFGRYDVGCVTKVGKPHILDVKVVERFVDGPIEFVSL